MDYYRKRELLNSYIRLVDTLEERLTSVAGI